MMRRAAFLRGLSLLLLLLCALPRAGVAAPAGPEQFRAEIDALVAGDAIRPPPKHGVLFVGSSSIRLWNTLAADFPGVPVINRGFGGSRIADSTFYAARIVTPYAPRLVVLYAGDNDVQEGRTPQQVVDDFAAFVRRVRSDLPETAIAFVSIKPSVARFALWPQMRAANDGIARWARTQRDVDYVDVASAMLDANGKPRPELFLDDGLHMRRAGYELWIAALEPEIERRAASNAKVKSATPRP